VGKRVQTAARRVASAVRHPHISSEEEEESCLKLQQTENTQGRAIEGRCQLQAFASAFGEGATATADD